MALVSGCEDTKRAEAEHTAYELPPQGQLGPLFEDSEGPSVVVSLAFDDGFVSQRLFFDILDEGGLEEIHGTFYLNSSRLNLEGSERDPRDLERYAPLDVWVRAAQDGHEIGSHTRSHRDLSCTQERYDDGKCQPGHEPIDTA